MTADLSDPAISSKYNEIISFTSPVDWLFLSYGQSRDKLSLYAFGEGGLPECRARLGSEADVIFAFLRVERSFLLISYVPEDISGVRRARALVHSRAVASLFKAQHATWTITSGASLTDDAVRSKLKLQLESPRSGPPTPSTSTAGFVSPPLDRAFTNGMKIVSPTEFEARRTRLSENLAPPTTPPKPSRRYTSETETTNPPKLSSPPRQPAPQRGNSTGQPPQTESNGHLSPDGSFPSSRQRTAAQEEAAASRARWAIENENERKALAKKRSQLELQREAEAEQQAQYDAERSARLKQERDEALRVEMDEDDRKRTVEQERARKLAADRVAEEQRRRDELAHKKALEAQRRRDEVAARIKREKEADFERERLALEKLRLEEEKLSAKRALTRNFSTKTGAVILTGNLTFQADDSMFWRRRYFELSNDGLALYKSSDTLSRRLDLIPLERSLRAISEKHDEIQAIPHSFALEFDDECTHLFFCDTQEDKDLLTSALLQVANL